MSTRVLADPVKGRQLDQIGHLPMISESVAGTEDAESPEYSFGSGAKCVVSS
jgi:hypothetical protein